MRARSCAALQSTLALAVLAAMVVLAATAPAAATATAPPGVDRTAALDSETSVRSVATAQSERPPRDGTELVVELRRNGDARWSVSTTFELTNESDRAAFEDLASRHERGNAEVGFDVETFRRANQLANGTVNRTMELQSVERGSTVIDGENGTAVGRVSLNFTWTNFGRASGDRLRVGSAFNTSDGTWLPGLTANQTLEIRPPNGYGIVTATVPPRAGVLRWEGPTTFEAGDVAATFNRNRGQSPTPTPTPTPTPATNTTTTIDDPGLPSTLVIVGGLGGLLLLLLAAGLLARRRTDDAGPEPGPASMGGDGGPPGADGSAADQNATANGSGAGATAAAGGDPIDEAGEETELLSDEERVERLLEENGGRMKQANIVSETGWSNAKVSQLLSAMDEDGRIDKLRIGRENLISLPDEDVTDFEE
jgi:uncharacterized membrane protein